jgi:hypothetical protein
MKFEEYYIKLAGANLCPDKGPLISPDMVDNYRAMIETVTGYGFSSKIRCLWKMRYIPINQEK